MALLLSEGQSYVTFRLSDVPKIIRDKAVGKVTDTLVRELQRDALDGPVPESVKLGALYEAVQAQREAIQPRNRRHFQVPVADWNTMMADAQAASDRARRIRRKVPR